MKKRFYICALASTIMLGLVACGKNDNNTVQSDKETTVSTETTASTEEPSDTSPVDIEYIGDVHSDWMQLTDWLFAYADGEGDNKRWYLINQHGDKKSDIPYLDCIYCNENFIIVQGENEKYGLVNLNGEVVYDCEYDGYVTDNMADGTFCLYKHDETGYVCYLFNSECEEICDTTYFVNNIDNIRDGDMQINPHYLIIYGYANGNVIWKYVDEEDNTLGFLMYKSKYKGDGFWEGEAFKYFKDAKSIGIDDGSIFPVSCNTYYEVDGKNKILLYLRYNGGKDGFYGYVENYAECAGENETISGFGSARSDMGYINANSYNIETGTGSVGYYNIDNDSYIPLPDGFISTLRERDYNNRSVCEVNGFGQAKKGDGNGNVLDGIYIVDFNNNCSIINQDAYSFVGWNFNNSPYVLYSTGADGNEKWGYLDATTMEPVSDLYDAATDFSGGYALVSKDGKAYIVDTEFQKVSEEMDGIGGKATPKYADGETAGYFILKISDNESALIHVE